MKTRKLWEMDLEDLAQRDRDLREELFNLRFQHSMGQLENPMRLRQLRREIARTLMLQAVEEAGCRAGIV